MFKKLCDIIYSYKYPIKGKKYTCNNFYFNKKSKYYNSVTMDLYNGDRYFANEKEAERNGFTKYIESRGKDFFRE